MGLARHPKLREPCENSQTFCRNLQATQELVNEEVAKGDILGPFDSQPLPNMVFSTLNIVPKVGSPGKWHLIHNFAWPYDDILHAFHNAPVHESEIP